MSTWLCVCSLRSFKKVIIILKPPQPPALIGDHQLLRRHSYHQRRLLFGTRYGQQTILMTSSGQWRSMTRSHQHNRHFCLPSSVEAQVGWCSEPANQGGIHSQPVPWGWSSFDPPFSCCPHMFNKKVFQVSFLTLWNAGMIYFEIYLYKS